MSAGICCSHFENKTDDGHHILYVQFRGWDSGFTTYCGDLFKKDGAMKRCWRSLTCSAPL